MKVIYRNILLLAALLSGACTENDPRVSSFVWQKATSDLGATITWSSVSLPTDSVSYCNTSPFGTDCVYGADAGAEDTDPGTFTIYELDSVCTPYLLGTYNYTFDSSETWMTMVLESEECEGRAWVEGDWQRSGVVPPAFLP